jgi:hypothetical protein
MIWGDVSGDQSGFCLGTLIILILFLDKKCFGRYKRGSERILSWNTDYADFTDFIFWIFIEDSEKYERKYSLISPKTFFI